MLSLVFVGVLLFALILDGFPGRDRELAHLQVCVCLELLSQGLFCRS